MIIGVFTIHGANGAKYAFFKLRTYYDRGFTGDKKKTKQLTQEDYEKLYMGPEYPIEARFG